MIELIHCKNPCKCHNVPPPSTTIKKKNKFKKVSGLILRLLIHLELIFIQIRDRDLV
jgi:hypothetical protein